MNTRALLFLSLFACGPDMSQVHIAQCMGDCEARAKQCSQAAGAEQPAIEACLFAYFDCINGCVRQLEQTFK